jgi:hypothetical protein
VLDIASVLTRSIRNDAENYNALRNTSDTTTFPLLVAENRISSLFDIRHSDREGGKT